MFLYHILLNLIFLNILFTERTTNTKKRVIKFKNKNKLKMNKLIKKIKIVNN